MKSCSEKLHAFEECLPYRTTQSMAVDIWGAGALRLCGESVSFVLFSNYSLVTIPDILRKYSIH